LGNFIVKSTVKSRGWTDSAINRFLGEPDKERPNPYSKKMPSMKLFSEDRVIEAEKTPEFEKWSKQYEARKNRGKEQAKLNQESFLEAVREHDLTIPAMPDDVLTRLAVDHFNERLEYRVFRAESEYESWGRDREDMDPDFEFEWPDDRPAAVDSELEFLARIKVNYLRHQETVYDEIIGGIAGKLFIPEGVKSEAMRILRRKTYAVIADAYPQLSDEVEKQVSGRGMR